MFEDVAGNDEGGLVGGGGLDGPLHKLKMRADCAARARIRFGSDFDTGDTARKHAGAGVVIDCLGAVILVDPRRSRPPGETLDKCCLKRKFIDFSRCRAVKAKALKALRT